MVISGKATELGTQQLAHNFPNGAIAPFGLTKLFVSQIGFGGYRISTAQPAHRQAVVFALQQGINLIDTSANYGDGRSETLIGQVLSEQIAHKVIRRESIVIITKAGYVQGQNYALAQARKDAGRPFPNMVKIKADLDHCIHPDFLEDQLTRSLARLNLETVDVFLLHNPEYYLSWAQVANIPLAEARDEYYRRIKQAFVYLESEAARGRIQWYGISSNTFPIIPSQYQFTSLEKVWEIAQSISPDHHFALVQLPLNLLETGAMTIPHTSKMESVITFAHQRGIGVLINRPLNAYHQQSLFRLADVLPPSYPTTPTEVSTVVDTLIAAEKTFTNEWVNHIHTDEGTRKQLQMYLAVGQTLKGQWDTFRSFHNWHELLNNFLLPRAQAAVEFLSNQENLSEALLNWLQAYIDEVNNCFAAVSAYYQESGHSWANRVQQTAVLADPDWEAPTLSQTAVRALRSTKGISSVLVGMRQERYVEEMLRELQKPVRVKDRHASWEEIKLRLQA